MLSTGQQPTITIEQHVTTAAMVTHHPGVITNPYYNLDCRNYARIAVYLDMIICPFEIGLCAFLIYKAATFLTDTALGIFIALTIIVSIQLITCFSELYLGWRLLSALNPESTPPAAAVRATRYWQVSNFALLLLEVASSILCNIPFPDDNGKRNLSIGNLSFVAALLRAFCAFIVYKFAEELCSFKVAQHMHGELVGSLPQATVEAVPVLAVTTTVG